MMKLLLQCWRVLRTIVGDDAYERYCQHHRLAHASEPLLDRRSFYLKDQQERWNGVRRCC